MKKKTLVLETGPFKGMELNVLKTFISKDASETKFLIEAEGKGPRFNVSVQGKRNIEKELLNRATATLYRMIPASVTWSRENGYSDKLAPEKAVVWSRDLSRFIYDGKKSKNKEA